MRCRYCRKEIHKAFVAAGNGDKYWFFTTQEEEARNRGTYWYITDCDHDPLTESEVVSNILKKYTIQKKNPFIVKEKPWKLR
jgi:hypothetical protein